MPFAQPLHGVRVCTDRWCPVYESRMGRVRCSILGNMQCSRPMITLTKRAWFRFLPLVHAPVKTDRSFAGMLMLVTGVAVVAALCQEHVASHPDAVDDPYAAFCTPVMAEAIVTPATPARHVISVSVPQDTPIEPVRAGATSGPMQVQRGDVIEFRVVSRREGAIAVHGFTEVVR